MCIRDSTKPSFRPNATSRTEKSSFYRAVKKQKPLYRPVSYTHLDVYKRQGSGKTRFWLTPQLLQAHSSYVVVDPKGGVLGQVGAFLQRRGYQIKVFNSIDFSKSMHLSLIHISMWLLLSGWGSRQPRWTAS